MKKIGVLTSGGDAPGMNAAVRAIVRCGIDAGVTVLGIYNGYNGLIRGGFEELHSRSVSNTLQRGGTILKTARSSEFETDEGLQKAKHNIEKYGLDGLMCVGGNGTLRGALDLAKIWGGQIIGLPGTIDNDLYGTDETIGYDTAVNTAVEAIDKIRDTAESHERSFFVEVMGRHGGFIALNVGVATGAEEVCVPEVPTDIKAMADRLSTGQHSGKTSCVVVVAEGDDQGGAFEVAEKMKQYGGHPYRVVVLGHLLRGGRPSARDRILATKLGAYSVDVFLEGKSLVMVGETRGEMTTIPIVEAVNNKKPLDPYLQKLFLTLAK